MKKKEIHAKTILIYCIIFLTFMGSNFLKFNIAGIKFNVARIAMIISCFILIFDLIKNKDSYKCIFETNVKRIVLFLAIWSAYSVINVFRTQDLYSYFINNFYLCVGTLNIIFFIKNNKTKENIKSIFSIINIATALNCIYYLYLFFLKNENIGGWYHNSNDLATLLLLSIPTSIYMIKNCTKIRYKILFCTITIIELFSFISISSRACVIAVGIASFIVLIVDIVKYKSAIKQKLFYKILIFLIIIVSIATMVLLCEKYIGKIKTTPVEKPLTSNDIRTNLIFNGLYFLKNNFTWLIGIGSGNAEIYLKNYSPYPTHNEYSFHNPYIEICVTYGIIVLIGIITIYIVINRQMIKIKIKEKELWSISTVFLFFGAAMAIGGISSSGIITRDWIWIIIAIIISYINHEKIEK